ncbi:MAG: tetratricopeptide repeat protein [Acidobacteria bacterium]|nr:tetratricopeptide repeat protein [Acidobacteriota bacterium]
MPCAISLRRHLIFLFLALCGLCLCARPLAAQTSALTFQELLSRAEAKTTAKEWAEAAALWEKVVEANPVEGRFWDRLANAYYNAKDYRKAIPAYEKSMELRAGFPSNAAYNIACCYALLGEKELALRWLDKAFEMGFRFLENAQTDTDLQSLHGDARFQKIVGLIETGKLTRDEGWRSDLALLAREVRRKGYLVPRRLPLAEFDAAVKKLSDEIPRLSDMQAAIEISKLMAKLGDGHTGLLGSMVRPEFQQTVPVQFYFFKEGLFIIAADPRYKELLGAQVLRFGDKTIDEVMRALDPLTSRDNEIWPSQVAPYRMRILPLLNALGLIPEAGKLPLTIKDAAGKTRVVTLEPEPKTWDIWNTLPGPAGWVQMFQTLDAPVPLYLKNMGTNYWYEYLPDSKTVYFQYNRVRNDEQEPLAQFTERLFKFINEHEVEKLVIDMRWNNGGNTFLTQPLLKALISNQKVNRRGHLFVIIGRRTFSAAQNSATFFERYTNAIFVGEPTGSSPNFVGEETIFTLPYSKLLVNVSDLYWESSWPQDYRTWIAPQLYTPPSFEAFRANRDPAMEAVLAYK